MTRSSPASLGGAEITEHRLKNGLRVLLVERHADPVVALMTWYRVGARNEREDEAGVSHFLEHMMFKGSRGFAKGEVDRITTELGGSNNAFTGYDHTAYWFELASDRWERALEIEADRMRHLSLDELEFNAEREVVLEELAMGKDDPWRRLTELVQTTLFARHPYRRPIIGHTDALREMTAASMRDYYRRFYHPGNATLVVCGDIRPRRALTAIRKLFGEIPAGPAFEEADCFRPAVDALEGRRRVSMTWPDRGSRMCMVWPGASVGSKDDWTLDVLSTALSSGRTSRLYRELVLEQGLATSVSTHNDSRVEGGVFWLMAECAQGVEPERLEAAINAELASLTARPLPTAELKRVKSILTSAEAYESETVTDLAETLGEFAIDADWRMAVEGTTLIQAVDAKRVQDCAQRLLDPERQVVGWCLPRVEAPAAPRPSKRRSKTRTKSRVKAKRARA